MPERGLADTFNMVPKGCVGGGVWGSPAIDTSQDQSANTVFIATGNPTSNQPPGCNDTPDYSQSVIALNATNLSLEDFWTVPTNQQISDGDFGSTVTIFQEKIHAATTNMVGIANKNGGYYAFVESDFTTPPYTQQITPAWKYQIAQAGQDPTTGGGSISPSAWDSTLNPEGDGSLGTL
jgi:glucose dehydrogenase